MAESHSLLGNSVVVYKRERSGIWQARLRLDDGTWHRVSTKTGDIDEAVGRAAVLYYEARVQTQTEPRQSSRKVFYVSNAADEEQRG